MSRTAVLLSGRAVRRWRLGHILPGKMNPAAALLTIGVDELVTQDGEKPCLQVAIVMPQMPSANRTFETVLNEIVSGIVLPHQRERIPAQCGNVLFQKNRGFVQDKASRPSSPAGMRRSSQPEL